MARAPGLAGKADVEACICEKVGIDGELAREDAGVYACFFDLPDVAPGKKGCLRWAALRGWAVGA